MLRYLTRSDDWFCQNKGVYMALYSADLYCRHFVRPGNSANVCQMRFSISRCIKRWRCFVLYTTKTNMYLPFLLFNRRSATNLFFSFYRGLKPTAKFNLPLRGNGVTFSCFVSEQKYSRSHRFEFQIRCASCRTISGFAGRRRRGRGRRLRRNPFPDLHAYRQRRCCR